MAFIKSYFKSDQFQLYSVYEIILIHVNKPVHKYELALSKKQFSIPPIMNDDEYS